MEWIELMIVVAIIGILAAIAIPAYQDYTRKAGDKACLGEAKGAANALLIAYSEQEPVSALTWKACQEPTEGMPTDGEAPDAAPDFEVTAAKPGTGTVKCGPSATCELTTADADNDNDNDDDDDDDDTP